MSNKQLYQCTHSLYPEDVTPKISLWLQLKHSNLKCYCCVSFFLFKLSLLEKKSTAAWQRNLAKAAVVLEKITTKYTN